MKAYKKEAPMHMILKSWWRMLFQTKTKQIGFPINKNQIQKWTMRVKVNKEGIISKKVTMKSIYQGE